MRHLLSWPLVLALFFALDAVPAVAGIAALEKRWDARQPLRVCFFGGSSEARSQIAQIAAEWVENTGLRFDFGRLPTLHSCAQTQLYDVRVSFDRPGFWAYVGTDARTVPGHLPTVNLHAMHQGIDGERRWVMLHQFGHVLGFLHQEQDPSTRCQQEFNIAAIQEATNWPQGMLEENTLVPNNGRYLATGFDPQSVMRLFVEPVFFKAGQSSPCYGPRASRLSDGDHALANLVYPPRPSDVSASEESPHLSIRFEGALAPEHYGSMLAALYDRGKTSLKKHIAIEGTMIGDVIAAEGIAPKGVVSKSLEQFLCRTNPHICREIRGKASWSNIPALINYKDQGIQCGDAALPKYVYWVPNVRLETNDIEFKVQYDAQRESLRNLVVSNLRGCNTLDDTCRSLIRGLNSKYKDLFTDTAEMLPEDFKGDLKLPARTYRLVVEYDDGAEREEIKKIVSDVIASRARQLRVPVEKIGIEVTEPIGNPKFHAGKIYSEPVVGYVEPLEIMHYPYRDERTEAALLYEFPPVHVAIWDTHVDDKHCDLTRSSPPLLYSTLSNVPSDE